MRLVAREACHPAGLHGLAIHPDGRVITVGTSFRVWDSAAAKPVADSKEEFTPLAEVVLHPDGSRAIVSSLYTNWIVRLDGTVQRSLPGGPFRCHPDGRRIVVRDSVWDLDSGTRSLSFQGLQRKGMPCYHPSMDDMTPEEIDGATPNASVNRVEFSPDGRRVILGTSRPEFGVFDLESGQGPSFSVDQELELVHPNGRWLFSRRYCKSPTLDVWEIETGRKAFSLDYSIETGSAGGAVAHPDGRRLLSSYDGEFQVWDLLTRQKILSRKKAHPHAISWIRCAADGLHAVTASDRDPNARVWDLRKGRGRVLRGGAESLRGLDLLGDARAVGWTNERVILWDPLRKEVLSKWRAPFRIYSVAVSEGRIAVAHPDGRVVFLTPEA